MWAWGINDFGQLGNGTTFYETSPTRVVDLAGCAYRGHRSRRLALPCAHHRWRWAVLKACTVMRGPTWKHLASWASCSLARPSIGNGRGHSESSIFLRNCLGFKPQSMLIITHIYTWSMLCVWQLALFCMHHCWQEKNSAGIQPCGGRACPCWAVSEFEPLHSEGLSQRERAGRGGGGGGGGCGGGDGLHQGPELSTSLKLCMKSYKHGGQRRRVRVVDRDFTIDA